MIPVADIDALPKTSLSVQARSRPNDLQDKLQRASSGIAPLASVAVIESYQPHPINPSKIEATKESLGADVSAAAERTQENSSRRIDTTAIEGVRALACLAVATGHWLSWYGEKKHGSIELQVREVAHG